MKHKGQLTLAWILIGFGTLLLIGNISGIDFGDFFWPLLLIVIGLLLVFRPQIIAPRNARFLFAGDVNVDKSWDLEKKEIRMFAGDVRIDLTSVDLPSGESTFTISAFASEADIIAPEDVGIAITTMAFVTESRIKGEKMEHVMSGMDYKSEGYEAARKKFKLVMQCFSAEVRLETK